jgi:hypothetical protein
MLPHLFDKDNIISKIIKEKLKFFIKKHEVGDRIVILHP